MAPIKRRQLIASLAVSSIGGLAGCATLTDRDANGSSQLGRVEIVNRHDSGHVVEVRVELNDDSTVHQEAYLLSADNPEDHQVPREVVAQSWPTSPAQVRVAARLKGRDWRSITAAGVGYPSCISVLINIDTNGNLALFTTSNKNRCEGE